MPLRSVAAALLLLFPLAAAAQEPLPEKKTDNSQGNVRFLTPNARVWSKAASKDGWTWYYVWLAEPDFCHLKIRDGKKLDGDFRKAFDAEVETFVAGHGKLKATNGVKESATREGVQVCQQTIEIEAKHGTVYAWCVGFHPDDRFELLMYTAGTEATWLKYAEDAKTFMTNLKFANVAEAPEGEDPGPAAGGEPEPAAGGAFQAGDKVDILFGGKWYPGRVLEAGEGKWKVHYDEYGDNWDSWVGADKIRKAERGAPEPEPKGPAPADPVPNPADGDPAVGETCEAIFESHWYEVEIVAIENGRFKCRWRGYGQKFDWFTRDQIRRKGEEKEPLPRKGREGDGGGLPPEQMVGKEVEVFWRGAWYGAVVEKTDGTRLYIRYKGENKYSTKAEWAVRERVRPVGGAAKYVVNPDDIPGRKGLSGLWYRIGYDVDADAAEIGEKEGKIVRCNFFFYEDGRVMREDIPIDADGMSYDLMRALRPENCGAYGIDGGAIRFEWGGDAPPGKSKPFERIDDGHFKVNGQSYFRARSFSDDERLSGEYAGTNGALKACWTFREDGTYEFIQVHTVTVDLKNQNDPGGTTVAEAKETRHKGRYRLRGHVLETTDEKGEVRRELAYPTWGPGEPKKAMATRVMDYIRRE